MRQIGNLHDQNAARVFSDYLYSVGIENEVESADGTDWTVWIHDEDHVKEAVQAFQDFQTDPADSKFLDGARRGRDAWKNNVKELTAKGGEVVDVRTQVFGRAQQTDFPFLTTGLIILSIGTTAVLFFSPDIDIYSAFAISTKPRSEGFLPEVLSGQVWRLLTPMFLHFSFLHIIFNMMWLNDLGKLLEGRHGTPFFAAMVFVYALLSNFGQYVVSGPAFGGMSGVVFGLLGYTWMRGRFDRKVDYALPQYIVVMMLIWYFICLFGLIGNIANTAHTVGLVLGSAWGFVSAAMSNAR